MSYCFFSCRFTLMGPPHACWGTPYDFARQRGRYLNYSTFLLLATFGDSASFSETDWSVSRPSRHRVSSVEFRGTRYLKL